MKNEKPKNKLSLKAKSYKQFDCPELTAEGLKAVVACFAVVIVLAFLFVQMGEVYAQPNPAPDGSGPHTFAPPSGTATFSDIVCEVIDFFSNTILPPIAVLMMLVVGFLFMMGGQMPQKAVAARKALLYVVAGVILLLLSPGIVGLVVDVTGASSGSFTACPGPVTTISITQTIAKLVNWFAWFVSVLSVVMGLYAGFLYLTARGDSSQVLKATKVFSYTIIGIAVAVVSFSIILLTRTLFGI